MRTGQNDLSRAKAGGRSRAADDPFDVKRDALPFFQKGKRGVQSSWWCVNPTGDYTKDHETGQQYAVALLPLMMYVAGPASLPVILGDMIAAVSKRRARQYRYDKLSGIEIGFMRGLGDIISGGIAATIVARNPAMLRSKWKKRIPSAAIESATKLTALIVSSAHEREHAANAAALAEFH